MEQAGLPGCMSTAEKAGGMLWGSTLNLKSEAVESRLPLPVLRTQSWALKPQFSHLQKEIAGFKHCVVHYLI